MKKRWMAVLLAGCMLMTCGCGSKKTTQEKKGESITEKTGQDMFPLLPTGGNGAADDGESGEVLQNEGDAQEEAAIRDELASMLPFAEGDDKICAIAYMGDSGQQQEENLRAFYEKYFPNLPSENWQTLPNFDYGGSQCYLIIPRYMECSISLNCMELSDEGNVQINRTEYVGDEAFLLFCSSSETFASAEVMLEYNDAVFVLVPRLSAMDGHVEPMQVALDLTDEGVYSQQ